MSEAERTKILKSLPAHSQVIYIGESFKGGGRQRGIGKTAWIIKNGMVATKIRTARDTKRHKDRLLVAIGGGQRWYIETKELTCKAIISLKALENDSKP